MGVHGYSKQNTSNPGGTFRVQRRAVETEGEKVAVAVAVADSDHSSPVLFILWNYFDLFWYMLIWFLCWFVYCLKRTTKCGLEF